MRYWSVVKRSKVKCGRNQLDCWEQQHQPPQARFPQVEATLLASTVSQMWPQTAAELVCFPKKRDGQGSYFVIRHGGILRSSEREGHVVCINLKQSRRVASMPIGLAVVEIKVDELGACVPANCVTPRAGILFHLFL